MNVQSVLLLLAVIAYALYCLRKRSARKRSCHESGGDCTRCSHSNTCKHIRNGSHS